MPRLVTKKVNSRLTMSLPPPSQFPLTIASTRASSRQGRSAEQVDVHAVAPRLGDPARHLLVSLGARVEVVVARARDRGGALGEEGEVLEGDDDLRVERDTELLGAPDHVVRTVTENSRTLKFNNPGFETE